MNIFSLGNGLISSHLKFPIIKDRINSKQDIINLIEKYNPNILINCIGKCGTPNIDWCENNKEITYFSNVQIPIWLAEETSKRNIKLIQLGSGCIFYGKSPNSFGWRETDAAMPSSFYSKTKYISDLLLKDYENISILRIRMPITDKNVERNFINKILKYKNVIDIPNSITFLSDFEKVVDYFISKNLPGIYHITNPTPLSIKNVLDEYNKYIDHPYTVISEEHLNKITIAPRSNCILNTDKLFNAGFDMTPTDVALKETIKNYIKNISA